MIWTALQPFNFQYGRFAMLEVVQVLLKVFKRKFRHASTSVVNSSVAKPLVTTSVKIPRADFQKLW